MCQNGTCSICLMSAQGQLNAAAQQQGLNQQNWILQAQASQGQLAQYQSQLNQAVYMGHAKSREMEFMEFIDGKTDEEIAQTFLEKQAELKRITDEKLETLRTDFMNLCKRFRPSITESLVERIGKLKAFW